MILNERIRILEEDIAKVKDPEEAKSLLQSVWDVKEHLNDGGDFRDGDEILHIIRRRIDGLLSE